MNVILQRGLGVRREAWQELLDDVLVLNLFVALELLEATVEAAQEFLHGHKVCKVRAMQLQERRKERRYQRLSQLFFFLLTSASMSFTSFFM